jgi:hypothetical protein
MRWIPRLSGLVLGVIGVLGGIDHALAGSALSSAAMTQQVDGNGVTVIATLLKE